MLINRHNQQRGDTIVEVLISIAIVSLILGGAYVTTNRSLQTTRQAEERGNGLKLVESQIEQLKGLVDTNPSAVFGASAPASFCVVSGAVSASTSTMCKVDASGNPTTAQPQYNLAITRSTNTFTVTDQWLSTGGKTTEQVTMTYRVYQ